MKMIIPDKEKLKSILENGSKSAPLILTIPLNGISPLQVYEACCKDSRFSFLLDSGKGCERVCRYSYIGSGDSDNIKVIGSKSFIEKRGHLYTDKGLPFDNLTEMINEYESGQIDYIDHFWGGYVGYISYDAVKYIENISLMNEKDMEIPDLYYFHVDELITIDHKEALLKIIKIIKAEDRGTFSYDDCVNHLKSIAERLNNKKDANSTDIRLLKNMDTNVKLESLMSEEKFVDIVMRAKEYIASGDIYQVNLSRSFSFTVKYDPIYLYKRLSAINPSPFGGLLKLEDLFIISSSPERLFKVKDLNIETRPIAGTRPRGEDQAMDKILKEKLIHNIKEQAEHIMLVDLERNDLGKICQYGTVAVDELMLLEAYSHVWHIVSNVKGVLRQGINIKDIICALFPGGTITGCPKIRSMEIIEELEPVSRGIYTGSMGYIGFNGISDMNIIIRSFVMHKKRLHFHVGAGIVADSVPNKEFTETEQKAGALIKSLALSA